MLIGAGAGGALIAAFALVPRHYAAPLVAGKGERVANAFLKLARDGTLTVAVPACEMGQGVTTLLAQIVAVELGADWAQVAVEPAPLSPAYADAVLAAHWAPLWLPTWLPILPDMMADPANGLTRLKAERGPMMLTVAGTGLAMFEQPLREAAAALRAQLIAAAAAQWGVAADSLDTRGHAVIERRADQQGRRLPFARLIDAALDRDPPHDVPLRASPAQEAPARFPAGSRPAFPRLDLPAKVDGSFVFAADVRLPGMVHAAIAHGPQGGCVLSSWDAQAAARVPGCLGVVHAKGWLAAIGVTWHAADRAVAAMEPRFRPRGPVADSNAIDAALDQGLAKGKPVRLWGQGDPTALLEKPSLSARYDIEVALHAPLEPATCTARLEHGRLELWLVTQAPEAARREGARAAGLSEADVVVYPMAAGGSFDTRLDGRIAGEAAALARATGKPVQLTWSRWQESLAGLPRAPVAGLLEAGMSPDKQQLLGWRSRIATPASLRETAARVLDGEGAQSARRWQDSADPLALEGAMPPYAIPECAVQHVPVALPLATARMRGGGAAITAFLTESFIDECAHFGGSEPLAFRMAMLGGQPRLAACLQGVAHLAMWGGGADASGQGIACHALTLAAPEGPRHGYIAVVATARQVDGAIRVEALSACVDIGRVINTDLARQQIEGGLFFGLGLAVGGSTGYAAGRPLAGHFSQLGLPLLADCPKVEIVFVESSAQPFDPGELGVVAVAPAIANALFSATGLRLRRLPLLSEGV
ncbi:molybdopterin cofactor-binding domain-containing protein [Novosphingobium sp. BK349]|uniref:molybdopterin cofactor-binding domain-containing protein n=1 Tax=unclassified Novosphingobium TaxID=2644732 RepID=UPI0017B55565|nr:isoquinoline 1-oxidoreductase beta subunit [Novosphingobium sp. BK256]MBB3376281.1 isoquinoline 1-oxidoreductase beta subunit [Novosphingobium sp. BK280]MBB3380695.1 isoquinoline 1-oxidoreductase beta subunit [Novosphingobium sp. BK258]MBB3422309.1 isoquinoline 1-oxidoreductase beta subunit [Novosphingobium sp. BK267]MBB3451009.1 isoquinoline 1-oxidoreductase beta subunit [Novosphingobium sp. BK352]MBB3479517.1 isoquinoline 1-oxidoreductase beta subunit [Novosphingobium sp. BK369]MBB350286